MRPPLEVEIMGQRLTVASDDGEEHVRQVARYVDQQMRQLAEARPPVTTLQLALVTALNIASEYRKLQHQQEELCQKVDRMAQRLVARLER
jgi:cell division protein ZapA